MNWTQYGLWPLLSKGDCAQDVMAHSTLIRAGNRPLSYSTSKSRGGNPTARHGPPRPLHEKNGTSASESKAVEDPLVPAMPTVISAEKRTSPMFLKQRIPISRPTKTHTVSRGPMYPGKRRYPLPCHSAGCLRLASSKRIVQNSHCPRPGSQTHPCAP